MKNDRLIHQAVELTEKFIYFIERRLVFDQFLHVFSKTGCHRAVDIDLALRVLVDDLIPAGKHRDMAVLRRKLDDTVVGAVLDHLHGDTPYFRWLRASVAP